MRSNVLNNTSIDFLTSTFWRYVTCWFYIEKRNINRYLNFGGGYPETSQVIIATFCTAHLKKIFPYFSEEDLGGTLFVGSMNT